MRLVDLLVPTSSQSLKLNPDLRSLVATQATRTAASDLRHCTTRAGNINDVVVIMLQDDAGRCFLAVVQSVV